MQKLTVKKENSLKHLPGLDALRGVAILIVLIGHFAQHSPKLQQLVSWGSFGVLLFFVLSGFLISRILLFQKDSAKSIISKLKTFYFRRTLRIFPIYYLTIFVCVFIGYTPVLENLPRLLTYTANIDVPWLFPGSYLGAASHMWSLSVEEQFYLLWPLILLVSPRKYVFRLMLFTFLLSILLKLTGLFFNFPGTGAGYFFRTLWGCAEALSLGAILAYLKKNNDQKLSVLRKFSTIAFILFPFLLIYRSYFDIDDYFHDHLGFGIIVFSVATIVSAGLVDFASDESRQEHFNSAFVSPLRWLGKISYGVYLYHLFMPAMFNYLIGEKLGRGLPVEWAAPLWTSSSIAIAVISYYLIEQPLEKLKNKRASVI